MKNRNTRDSTSDVAPPITNNTRKNTTDTHLSPWVVRGKFKKKRKVKKKKESKTKNTNNTRKNTTDMRGRFKMKQTDKEIKK